MRGRLGRLKGRMGREVGGGGEDRDARMYVFEVKQKPKWKQKPKFNKKTQKRPRGEESSSDSE